MTEIEKVKMPWWQKVFCVVLAFISLERLYSFRVLLLGTPALHRQGIAWVQGVRLYVLETVTGYVLSFLFDAFFFFVLARHWKRDEPL